MQYKAEPYTIAPNKAMNTDAKTAERFGTGYGGTKHSTAAALGEILTPEEVKRGGTGSTTNKAFERYFQPRRAESTIKELQKKKAGKIVKMPNKKILSG